MPLESVTVESSVTEEDLNSKILGAMEAFGLHEVVSECTFGTCQLSINKESVLRLQAGHGEGSWLDDTVMEAVIRDYLDGNTAVQMVGNSFFHKKLADPECGGLWEHSTVANWTRHSSIHEGNHLIVLFCEELHWHFIHVAVQCGIVEAVDSLGCDRSSSMHKVHSHPNRIPSLMQLCIYPSVTLIPW